MTPVQLTDATRVLDEGKHAHLPLCVYDVDRDGTNFMHTLWTPTADELAQLNAGSAVCVIVIGDDLSPMFVTVQ